MSLYFLFSICLIRVRSSVGAHVVLRKFEDGAVWINSRGSCEKKRAPVRSLGHPHVCLTTDVFYSLLEDEKLNFSDQFRFL